MPIRKNQKLKHVLESRNAGSVNVNYPVCAVELGVLGLNLPADATVAWNSVGKIDTSHRRSSGQREPSISDGGASEIEGEDLEWDWLLSALAGYKGGQGGESRGAGGCANEEVDAIGIIHVAGGEDISGEGWAEG